jgi:hypothetical protein
MAAKLSRLTHKIAIQVHKLLDAPSYMEETYGLWEKELEAKFTESRDEMSRGVAWYTRTDLQRNKEMRSHKIIGKTGCGIYKDWKTVP